MLDDLGCHPMLYFGQSPQNYKKKKKKKNFTPTYSTVTKIITQPNDNFKLVS